MKPIGIAEERQMDWLLAEALGSALPPDRRAAIAARVAHGLGGRHGAGARTQRWLAAALIPFAAAVAFGVAWLRRAEPETPAQDPAPVQWHEAHGPDALGVLSKDIRHLKCFDMTDEAMAGLAVFTALESLDLSGMDVDERGVARSPTITGDGFEHLRGLQKLRWLSVSGINAFTGAGLRHLAELPLLEHLDLTYTDVGEEGLGTLQRLPSLRELSLAHCGGFPGSALSTVGRCVGLRRLSLDGCYTVRGADLAALAGLRELRHLDLSDCMGAFRGQVMGELAFQGDGVGVTDEGLAALAALPLSTLVVDGCAAVTDVGISTIARMATLQHLGMGGLPKVTAAVLTTLPERLTTLGLQGMGHFEPRDLRQVARLRNLRELDLGGLTAMTDEDLTAILGPLRLRVLRLAGASAPGKGFDDPEPMKLTPAAARAIAAQRDLEELTLDRAPWLDAAGVADIVSLPNLRVLSLQHNAHLTDATLAGLGAATKLESLSLDWCRKITSAALEPLAKAPLKSLSVYQTNVLPKKLTTLAENWPGCTILGIHAKRFTVPMPRAR